jgi:PIN domain nuclease of toxin-antitoxin system
MILLDTSGLIWWANRNADLSASALGDIEAQRPGGTIFISAISAWEIAHWAARPAHRTSRLALPQRHPAGSPLHPHQQHHSPGRRHFAGPHPAALSSRILAATARHTDCPLVTRDAELQAYIHIKTIW